MDEKALTCAWLETFTCHDFKKRQAKIMALLLRLSMEKGSPEVHIPHLKDFEICGVSKTKIRYELEELEAMNVVFWNREEKIFAINPNIDEWKMIPHSSPDTGRLRQLIDLNSI